MGTVKLHAVVKEDLDTEIEDFREFFKGEIHLDEKVCIDYSVDFFRSDHLNFTPQALV